MISGNAKIRKLMRAVDGYLDAFRTDLELRFDVVSITLNAHRPEILHITDAFYPTLDEQS